MFLDADFYYKTKGNLNMEKNQDPLAFLTEFIDRNGWMKLKRDFIPQKGDPLRDFYKEVTESIEYEFEYIDEDGDIDPGEVKIYFSKTIAAHFFMSLNSDVRDKINQYLFSLQNHEEKKHDFKWIIGQLEYFQNQILTKEGLKKYAKFLDLQNFINNLKIQHAGLSIREITPNEIQVMQILKNFGNAIKKITKKRRKDHKSFEIVDEYDVQDLLYVILKSVYPKLITEDPIPKVGSKSTKIDLILREQGILIEVKIINATGNSENSIIDDLKKDIESYHVCQWLKTLICFVYDPQNLIKDNHSFRQLEGERTKNGRTFEVKMVIQR